MKYYAGIGARATPPEILEKMESIAKRLSSKGYTLRSGGARGADKAFEDGCISARGNAEIFKPDGWIPAWTNFTVELFHPAPERLNAYSRRLMQRNALILLGYDGNTPVEFVVCWTKDDMVTGGTGHTLRMAEYLGIPIYNLATWKGEL